MRKLLALIMTVTTIMLVVIASQKLLGPKPEGQPLVKKDDPNGGITPLPKDKERLDGTFEEAVESIKEEKLRTDLYYLASDQLEGRMSGKNGNKLAAEYIKQQFESFGLKTMYHKFRMPRYNPGPKNEQGDDYSQNIYAWIEGTDPLLKNEIVVIGAHMDHIGYGPKGSMANRVAIHPGADDNASGTVALLAIAKAFSLQRNKCKRTVVFQAYSGEEMGLIGSRFYVENPVFPLGSPSISKHVAMINMDMIGYLRKGQYQATFYNEASSVDIDEYINELNGKYSFAKSVSGRGGGGSDHAPFYNKRVPVVCLHTGMHRAYHTPDDKANQINYKGLEQVARYAFELSYRVVSGGSAPRFNHATFKAMDYSHDHGWDKVAFPVRD